MHSYFMTLHLCEDTSCLDVYCGNFHPRCCSSPECNVMRQLCMACLLVTHCPEHPCTCRPPCAVFIMSLPPKSQRSIALGHRTFVDRTMKQTWPILLHPSAHVVR